MLLSEIVSFPGGANGAIPYIPAQCFRYHLVYKREPHTYSLPHINIYIHIHEERKIENRESRRKLKMKREKQEMTIDRVENQTQTIYSNIASGMRVKIYKHTHTYIYIQKLKMSCTQQNETNIIEREIQVHTKTSWDKTRFLPWANIKISFPHFSLEKGAHFIKRQKSATIIITGANLFHFRRIIKLQIQRLHNVQRDICFI